MGTITIISDSAIVVLNNYCFQGFWNNSDTIHCPPCGSVTYIDENGNQVTQNDISIQSGIVTIQAQSIVSYTGCNIIDCSVTNLNPFDYLVIRYSWNETAGRDLDTFTGFINTGTSYDSDWVGFGQGEPQVPTIAIQSDLTKSYLRWATDNTTTSGVEAILINFKQLSQDFDTTLAEEIKAQLAAVWYGERLTGDIQIELSTYLGGTMNFDQPNFNFVNTGGTLIQQVNVNKNVINNNQGANIAQADILGTVNYNRVTKQATLQT